MDPRGPTMTRYGIKTDLIPMLDNLATHLKEAI